MKPEKQNIANKNKPTRELTDSKILFRVIIALSLKSALKELLNFVAASTLNVIFAGFANFCKLDLCVNSHAFKS